MTTIPDKPEYDVSVFRSPVVPRETPWVTFVRNTKNTPASCWWLSATELEAQAKAAKCRAKLGITQKG